jgi:class 3 adenylate cyclase
MTESRRLAAIMAADVVGFSRLTSVYEDRTLARLRALRSDLIDPTISVHKGRVVKHTGDGALSRSAVSLTPPPLACVQQAQVVGAGKGFGVLGVRCLLRECRRVARPSCMR